MILVKTIVNTKNNTLAKSIADTNTSTAFEIIPILLHDNTFTVYYIQQHSVFPWSSVNEVNRMIVVEKMAKLL